MRRLTKIKQSIYKSERYAVYVSKDGKRVSAMEMTAKQTQQVLDTLAMYEDLDELGLVEKMSNSAEPLRETEPAKNYDVDTLLDWLEEKLNHIEKAINRIEKRIKKYET